MENQYPECEKMWVIKAKSQVIDEFLDWLLNEKEFVIAHYGPYESDIGGETLVCDQKGVEILLAEFFDIDLDKVEKERRQMLDGIRGKK